MLVSVVMASYNKGAYIKESIRSILVQTYPHWELIVVDDCSTDNTAQILEEYSGDARVQILRSDVNKGANACRNQGLARAKGDYVVFIDADDLLAPGCLSGRVSHAEKHPEKNLLVFSMGVFHSKVGDDARTWVPLSRQPLQDFLQHKLPWSILQPFWKKSFLQALVGFDERFTRLQDVELNTRALFHPDIRLEQVGGEPDCYYRIDEGRANFQTRDILSRYVQSAVAYYNSFYKPAKALGIERFLAGTIYKTQQRILLQGKLGNLERSDEEALSSQLFTPAIKADLGFMKRLVFSVARGYNRLPLRIPGINWLLTRMCIA